MKVPGFSINITIGMPGIVPVPPVVPKVPLEKVAQTNLKTRVRPVGKKTSPLDGEIAPNEDPYPVKTESKNHISPVGMQEKPKRGYYH
jgi:hypothetical protein